MQLSFQGIQALSLLLARLGRIARYGSKGVQALTGSLQGAGGGRGEGLARQQGGAGQKNRLVLDALEML